MPTFSFALCADDYALTPGVSAGILELIEDGRLTATSALTTGSYWAEGARALRSMSEEVEVGLHLNLTLGVSLSQMPQLAPRGNFPTLRALLMSSWMGNLKKTEIQQEIAHQFD